MPSVPLSISGYPNALSRLALLWRGLVFATVRRKAATKDPLGLNDPALLERFVDEDRQLTLRNAKIGCWFVIVITPFCALLDVWSYPQHFTLFFILRLISSTLGLALLLSINRPFGHRYFRLYPALLPLIPSLCISYMIYISGDPCSHYYAGLSFCMVATCFVFNWTFKEIAYTLATIFTSYLAATLPHILAQLGQHEMSMYFANTTFLSLNCVVLAATSFQHHNVRVSEFKARSFSESKNEQIRTQNEALIHTIDKLRNTEAQLNHSDRLASIGRLSAGIIHEINNPLNFVKSALYVLNKKTKSMPPDVADSVRRIANDVGEGVDRVVGIVSDLRTFAHPEKRMLHPIDLSQTIHRAERFLAKNIQDKVIQLTLRSDSPLMILGDDREVLQVLINLIQNSIDALENTPNPAIIICAWAEQENVHLSVEDNGSGIEPAKAAHIFDPFFTTKEVGKGMGLGLSICYRLMQQMEGDIDVESVLDEYTRFTLSFQKAPL